MANTGGQQTAVCSLAISDCAAIVRQIEEKLNVYTNDSIVCTCGDVTTFNQMTHSDD